MSLAHGPDSAEQAEGPPLTGAQVQANSRGGGNGSLCVFGPFYRQEGATSSQTAQGANFRGGSGKQAGAQQLGERPTRWGAQVESVALSSVGGDAIGRPAAKNAHEKTTHASSCVPSNPPTRAAAIPITQKVWPYSCQS